MLHFSKFIILFSVNLLKNGFLFCDFKLELLHVFILVHFIHFIFQFVSLLFSLAWLSLILISKSCIFGWILT